MDIENIAMAVLLASLYAYEVFRRRKAERRSRALLEELKATNHALRLSNQAIRDNIKRTSPHG